MVWVEPKRNFRRIVTDNERGSTRLLASGWDGTSAEALAWGVLDVIVVMEHWGVKFTSPTGNGLL